MPFAVTHMLVPMILLDIIRDNILKLSREKFQNKYILLAGLFGLIPDLDIPLSLITIGNFSLHRTFSHSLWIPLFLITFSLVFWLLKKHRWSLIFLMGFVGFASHILLDFITGGDIYLLSPIINVPYGLNLFPVTEITDAVFVFVALDAILLWTWFFKIELKKRIQDFF